MIFKYISLLILLTFSKLALSQIDPSAPRTAHVTWTDEKIEIDGLDQEGSWSRADQNSDFVQNKPVDGIVAGNKTEVRLLNDKTNLYIFAICYDQQNLVINTLKRDSYGDSDEFAVLIDPQGQKSNGYGFGVNAFGAQTEVLIQLTDSDFGWDNKWFSVVKRYEDRWVAEISIPFKTLRYNVGSDGWRINFIRTDPGLNQVHAWSPIPRQFDQADLGYFGNLKWEKAPESQGNNISIIPYATVRSSRVETSAYENSWGVGGDAKIGITPSLNLDLTANPDFSQVDVDRQVTNLTRFNIFFPERRQFFIENGDVFTGFGLGENQLFYSRRVGLDEDGNTVPILFGARVTGNITDKTRLGIFDIHTENSTTNKGNNYAAFSVQQRIFKRSQIRGIFLNRQSYLGNEQELDFGRNAGVDVTLSTADGKWSGYSGYMHSFKEGYSDKNNQKIIGVNYRGTNLQMFVEAQHSAKNFYTDMGFNSRIDNFDEQGNLLRIGYTSIGSIVDYNYYPSNSKSVNVHWSGLENFVWVNDDGSGLNEWYTRLRHFIIFKNTSELRFRTNYNYIDVLFPFNLRNATIAKGIYENVEFNVQYNSDTRKKVQGSLFAVYGSFFEGTKFTYRTNLLLRIQPWGNFTIGYENNIIKLPNQSERTHISLASAKSEISLSTKFFWTTFVQYNAQSDFFNINTRFQYRYAPMSDVFLVFTDTYESDLIQFINKNRSVILKVNFWLGL